MTILINSMEIADKFLGMNGKEKHDIVIKQLKASIGEDRFNMIGENMICEIIEMMVSLTKDPCQLKVNFKQRCCWM